MGLPGSPQSMAEEKIENWLPGREFIATQATILTTVHANAEWMYSSTGMLNASRTLVAQYLLTIQEVFSTAAASTASLD